MYHLLLHCICLYMLFFVIRLFQVYLLQLIIQDQNNFTSEKCLPARSISIFLYLIGENCTSTILSNYVLVRSSQNTYLYLLAFKKTQKVIECVRKKRSYAQKQSLSFLYIEKIVSASTFCIAMSQIRKKYSHFIGQTYSPIIILQFYIFEFRAYGLKCPEVVNW